MILVVDMVGCVCMGTKSDSATCRWKLVTYNWNSGFTDNSVAQWGAIGMLAAEEVWEHSNSSVGKGPEQRLDDGQYL